MLQRIEPEKGYARDIFTRGVYPKDATLFVRLVVVMKIVRNVFVDHSYQSYTFPVPLIPIAQANP